MRRPSLFVVAFAVMAAALAGTTVSATTLHVSADGSGNHPTIQAAVDAAAAGDIVELDDGVFTGPGNRDIRYHGKRITIRSRSGNASACVIDCDATPMDPHRAFIFDGGESADAVLEAVRVRGAGRTDRGGAVLCDGASPTLRDVEFFDNTAGFGGGLACIDGARPTIERALFSANQADFGSAAACHAASPRFIDCRFVDNAVAEIGGALLCEAGSHPIVEDCVFANNEAEIGGGIACRDASNPVLFRCEFRANLALAGGGEGGGAWCANSSPVFQECVFAFNQAGGHGGAVVCVFASPRFVRCTLVGNAAPVGAGVYSWLDSSPHLERTIIAFSPAGDAVACEFGGTASLVCCDLWANAGGDWTASIAAQMTGDTNNFSADPLFCDPGAGDVHLRTDSPCAPGMQPHTVDCGVIGALGPACGPPGTADLSLRKVADRTIVHPDERVTFTITLTNLGPAMARNIVFGDPLPDPLNLFAFAVTRGAVIAQTFCAIDSLAPNDSVTATVVATPIANPAPSEHWFENTAYIDAAETPDPVAGNNQASLRIHISELPSDAPPGGMPGRVTLSASPTVGGRTRLQFSLPRPEPRVDLAVFDVRGRRVAVLARGSFASGDHAADWQHGAAPAAPPSGVYWVRLHTSSDTVVAKVHLVR